MKKRLWHFLLSSLLSATETNQGGSRRWTSPALPPPTGGCFSQTFAAPQQPVSRRTRQVGWPGILGLGLGLICAGLFFQAGLAISRAEEGSPREKPLRVVTTILPLQAHTLAIVGESKSVVTAQLLGGETGPHEFQLAPSHVRLLTEADLLILNGGGLEKWVEDLLQRAGNKNLRVVDTSAGITPADEPSLLTVGSTPEEENEVAGQEEAEAEHHHHETGEADPEHHHHQPGKAEPGHHHHHHHHGPGEECGTDGVNPHFWLDPVLAAQQAQKIAQALQEADPAQADVYAANAKKYLQELSALDAEFRETLAPLPNKNLVTFHAAFPYLARRYGLVYVGYLEAFPEREPTPQQLAGLVQAIKEKQVAVVFAEKGYSPVLLQRVAELSGARVAELDTLELGEGTPTAYLDRMRENLRALRTALAGKPEAASP